MKKITLLATLFVTLSLAAQQSAPEGWDEVVFEGKRAYMNINTGEISSTYPKGAARRKVKNYSEPVSYATGEFHVVEKGQTLYRISKISGVSVDELKRLNNLTSNNIGIGQKLKIK